MNVTDLTDATRYIFNLDKKYYYPSRWSSKPLFTNPFRDEVNEMKVKERFFPLIETREPECEEILKSIGGINMNGKSFAMLGDIDKVIIRLKDGKEFEGSVTRAEYGPGHFGGAGYSELTVSTIMPTRKKQYGIKKVIFNNPATVVFWEDGTRTVVYCHDNMKKVKKTVKGKEVEVMKPQKSDTYSEEVGLAMALLKKHYGNGGSYNNIFRKFIPGMKEREKAEKKARKAKKREEKTDD